MAALGLALGLALAAGPVSPNKPNVPPGPEVTNAVLKRIEGGVFELGKVRINQPQRSLTFPALLNMSEGFLEYVLVHNSGKLHESLLRTEAEPYHIHIASLLLRPPGLTNASPTPGKLDGPRATVWLDWKYNGHDQHVRAQDVIWNMLTRTPMKRGDWIYTGSRIIEGNFVAQRDGSIVSIIADEDALINDLLPERENDKIWLVNTNLAPPVKTPVTVTIQFNAHEKKP